MRPNWSPTCLTSNQMISFRICLSVCPFICLSFVCVCRFVCLSVCFVCLCICLAVSQSIYLPPCQTCCVSACLPAHLPAHLLVCLLAHESDFPPSYQLAHLPETCPLVCLSLCNLVCLLVFLCACLSFNLLNCKFT